MRHTPPYPARFRMWCLDVWSLVLGLVLCWPPPATARQPREEPAWFIQSVVAEPIALPSGLRVQQMNDGFELINTSATPVYVLFPVAEGMGAGPPLPIKPPTDMHANHKLVDGHAFFWGLAGQPPQSGWYTTPALTSFWLTPQVLWQYAPSVAQPVRRGDDRPPNVPIPPPQPGTLALVREQDMVYLPFTLQHALNPHYASEVQSYHEAIAAGQRREAELRSTLLLVQLMGGGLVVGLLVLVVSVLTYRQPPRDRANTAERV